MQMSKLMLWLVRKECNILKGRYLIIIQRKFGANYFMNTIQGAQ